MSAYSTSLPGVGFRFYVVCDDCGRETDPMMTTDVTARRAAEASGWLTGNPDLCPRCKAVTR